MVEADVFVKTSQRIAAVQIQTVKDIVSLKEKRHVILDHNRLWHRDCNRLRHRDSHGLRDMHRDRHWIGNLNRDVHWVWDRSLNSVRYWLLHRDRIRLRDVHGIGFVYRDRNRHLHRDRHVFLDSDRVWLGHGYRDFFSDGNCLDVSFVGQAEPTETVVQLTISVPQTEQSPLVLLLLSFRGLLLDNATGCRSNSCQQNCAQLWGQIK